MKSRFNLPPMNVLLVEDDLDFGEGLLGALQAEGYGVQWLRRLSDARVRLFDAPPDLLILDLGLPDGEGHALLGDVRRESSELPVLVLSARDALGERLRCLDGDRQGLEGGFRPGFGPGGRSGRSGA
jgi:DNA-binding response OmpR family regulator